MGYYVHLHVAFACDENEPVARLAKKYLAQLAPKKNSDSLGAARRFLRALSRRTSANPGEKGGISIWGEIGNYTRGDQFCQILRPFWNDLLTTHPQTGGPLDFEHILVFCEPENHERTTAYEIFLDHRTRKLAIKTHLCPFAFMQR